MFRLVPAALVTATFCLAQAPAPAFNPTKALVEIARQAEAAKQYTLEGELQLAGQRGTAPGKILSQARVRLAVGTEGRYLLKVEAPDRGEYLLVSNGQKSWAYVPKLKQYTEEETAVLAGDDEDEDDGGAGGERDLAETFARQVIPILARVYKTAEAASLVGEAEVHYERKKQRWPVVRVISKPNRDEGQSMTDLALDPASGHLGKLIWSNVTKEKEQKVVIRLTLDFTSLQMGEAPPDSSFDFVPPKGAKRVDAVPITGQTGSLLVNHAAPDFDLKTLEGERIRLAGLRGRPVLLTFMASWCGPCRREMPGMIKLHNEFKSRGLVILGVNDEGKAKARKFADELGMTFSVLDDADLKAHRSYRVRAIPAVYLIDGEGKIVRFLRGTHDYESLRAALKAVGM